MRILGLSFIAVGVAGVTLFCASAVEAREPILSISEIRNLSSEEAEQKLPVHIEAQVIRAHPRQVQFFAFADNAGIYVKRSVKIKTSKQQKVGDWVRIRGTTSPGEFAPDVIAEEIEVLREDPLPGARPFLMLDINSPGSDCDWVSVSGRLTAMAVEEEKYDLILLTLEMQESISMGVQIPYSKEAVEKLSDLMFQQVRFNAVIGSVFNGMRQLTGRVFLVNSVEDIQLLSKDESPDEVTLFPIHELMRVKMNQREAVRTQGTVTYAAQQEIFLRGDKSSIKVAVQNGCALRAGQTVEIEGFVWPQPISPAFRARTVAVLEEGAAPEAKSVLLKDLLGQGLASDLLDSKLNYELVSIKAQLVEVGKSFGLSPGIPDSSGQASLLCRTGDHFFEARLPAGLEASGKMKPGALLELTGICNLIENKRLFSRLYLEGLWLQIRNEGDLVILQPAPWWTPKRMLWIAGLALGSAVLFLIWVVVLRKVVERQTGIIGEKIERETVLDERQRIARELHDNLEQGLTGTAIQLQSNRKLLEINAAKWIKAIKQFVSVAGNSNDGLENRLKDYLTIVEEDSEKSLGGLKTVQDMLSYCGEESRTSVLDLRGGLLERMDLVEALKEALALLAEECGARLDIKIEGIPRRLKQVAERNLLLVAKEAASNAARHSAPKEICLKLVYEIESLSLRVEDDGDGFQVDQLPNAGRFGLQGMHERINRLGGTVCINSASGKGTSVWVELPSTQEWELE